MKILIAVLLFSINSFAKITITQVDGASSIDSGTTPIIYGGTAGPAGTCVGTATCNTCTQGVVHDAFVACNLRRININTRLTVSLISDAKDGKAYITKEDGTTLLGTAGSTTTKGNGTFVQTTWGQICAAAATPSSDCETITATAAHFDTAIPVRIGIDGDNDQRLTSAADDFITGSMKVQNSMEPMVDATTAGSTSAASNGIHSFSVYPGDAKVYLEDILAWDGFPASSNGVQYSSVLLMAHKVPADACVNTLFGNSDADPANGFVKSQDLDSGGNLPDERFFGYDNDTDFYMFKVALQDRAGNIGQFTKDVDCKSVPDTTGEDHVAKPGEVFGLLKDQQNCFISTAAFGSRLAPQVNVFRAFRDQFLVKNSLGRKLVLYYYDHSPKYAKIIAENENLRLASRIVLYPFLAFAMLALKIGFLSALVLLFAIVVISSQAWSRLRKKAKA
jgi:hypothetical protein